MVSSVVFQTPGRRLTIADDYGVISNYSSNHVALSTQALSKLREKMPFNQLRFFCRKNTPGRTFNIAITKTALGENVVKYFTAKTNSLPIACGSFYLLPNDDSMMADDCSRWGKENGSFEVGKWHHSGMNVHDRLFNHVAFIFNVSHWNLGSRWECDDYFNLDNYEVSNGDFWKMYVR